ncbi:hypothetical protein [Aporhodopirellula aestuarii]|uniref:GIY-YIG domain-containing protein n=1 Tax=Aporhodopirellula aestuarii TaxID=2950107 RepID=A0ABT0U2G6_9BACT|nr:hypothetical protein [Aporhodopirellula aestuarii]MCM2371072.1 hypothetical protein [Aporhodopirellula aestuarii]
MTTNKQFVYGLVDPAMPQTVRYVGRTNDIGMRYRMHVAKAAWNFTIKDVWPTYLSYAGRKAELIAIEELQHDDQKKAEDQAKERERYWIRYYVGQGVELFNGSQWSEHSTRKSIPKGVKTAWCETHGLLWDLDRNWEDELSLLRHLDDDYGSIMKEEPQPNGSIHWQKMASIPFAQSQYERRRFRTRSVLRALLSAHPTLAVLDLEIVNLSYEQ